MSEQPVLGLRDLPAKKQRYIRARLSKRGISKKVAAMEAGYAESTACVISEKVETPDVKAVFRSLVQAALPPADLIETLREGIKADLTKLAQHEGKFTDERKVPDYSERRAYLELAAEYGGYVQRDEPVSTHLHMIGMLERDPGPGPQSDKPAIDVPSVPVPGQ